MLTPNTVVQIWDNNDELYQIRLLTLMAWTHGLKAEVHGFQMGETRVEDLVRRELSIPNHVTLEEIYRHVQDSYDDIREQLGLLPA